MVSGYSTEIQYDGVVYQVQTEDKGTDKALIVSSVFVAGTIIASKRTPYNDLLTTEFDEETLAQKLQHQHKLMCAAVNAGRIEELKRLK
jgi:hypothetical protein